MGEQRHIRSRSWNRIPTKRCSANGIMEEFIVVDDDEVIILDFPESSKRKASSTSRSGNESVLQKVISIDDDEEEEEDDDEETEDVPNGGSSSSGNPVDANLQTAAEVDNDDCQFVQEKRSAFRFSKCNLSTSAIPGFRFGLDSDTESDFLESDCSDCEILEGSSREVREQWEKANSRKIKKAGKAGLSKEAGPSNLHCDTNSRPDFERGTEQQGKKSSFFAARKSGKAGLSKEAGPSNLHCDANFRPDFENGTEQHDQTPSFFAARKAGPSEEAGPSNLHCDTNVGPGFESGTEQHDQTSFFFTSRNPNGGKETSSTFFGIDGSDTVGSYFAWSRKDKENRANNRANSSFCNKEDFPGPSPLSPEIQVEHERFDTPSTHFTSSKEPIHQTSFEKVVERPNRMKVQCKTSQPPKENQKKNAAYQSYSKEAEEEEDASKSSPPQTSVGDRARCEHEISSLNEPREPISDPIPSTSGQALGINGTAPVVDVMLNREKLKETDEYKKAQEEEWLSRQQQLQIQAEEAQRQRKRRKLENTRQLEVERRQKERVEEVRETQKKDEESMNMKEKARVEITKSLKRLELTCVNMASLLRSLGIHVAGGTSPLPQEVHAAYKRAVLKFHPDRASGGDIKQQVEAEEKFKLIARMKDKFSSVSFR
ncbi:hypothetical protein V5N11_001668 [Cardamine amara subsp. amara]|uniref:J domain-containing protein n=1 Tax=Cardamine amara subsp. amara TaxID=228776 RepID=A0ABD1BMS9_CARAN